jgi:hypothetical protein
VFVVDGTKTREPNAIEADGGAAAAWSGLYQAGGIAALITVLLIPIQLAVFIANLFPDSVTGWFKLLQDNPMARLIDLDLLLVVDNVLLVAITLALYVALRPTSPTMTTIATGLWLLSIAMFIAANPAMGMLSLSDQFAAATSEAQRSMAVVAGQACWRAGRAPPSRSAMWAGRSPASSSGWPCYEVTASAGRSRTR